MKIKSPEWLNFKSQLIKVLTIFGEEKEKFDFPEEIDNFIIYVDGCEVNPIFQKKNETLRVEYDMMLCNTSVRTISFQIYKDAHRIEITLKNDQTINDNF